MKHPGFFLIASVLMAGNLAFAAARQTSIPLDHGVLPIHALNAVLCQELGLPNCPDRSAIDLRGSAGDEFLLAVNACLWNGATIRVQNDSAAIVQFESSACQDKCEALRRLARIYFAEKHPHATAAQARNWGLNIPQRITPDQPLVVLIHGLDSDRSDCFPMAQLLQQSGRQIAYFSYPGDQPIADSAALLARSLKSLRMQYPTVPIDLVTHSMGGLVARQYVEGPDYAGNVRHLIMVAPPNGGSQWARARMLLSFQENYHLRHDNPDWHWSWLITEGMGEAGEDLLPGSSFLQQLNNFPRRPGVKYTIVAGDKSGVNEVEGNCFSTISHWVPGRARRWWGIRTCCARLERAADHIRQKSSDGDGPVSLQSAQLPGVGDFVVRHADHVSLFMSVAGQPPAAWPIIEDRLAH